MCIVYSIKIKGGNYVMISVVMATYNGEEFIEKQLESIRNQSLKPDEVIICDDCSTDSTERIIVDFIKKYNLLTWKYERNTENYEKVLHEIRLEILCHYTVLPTSLSFNCQRRNYTCRKRSAGKGRFSV